MGNYEHLIDTMIEITSEAGVPLLSEDEMRAAAQSRSVLVRSLVAQSLAYYPTDFAEPLLLKLIADKNADVRSGAAIGMEQSRSSQAVIDALQATFLNDPDPLVRGYSGDALLALAHEQPIVVDMVKSTLTKERNVFTRAICYGRLYKHLHQEEFLDQLLRCLKSKKYQTRCAVCNTLCEVMGDMEDRALIKVIKTLDAFFEKETAPAVKSSIQNAKKLQEGS